MDKLNKSNLFQTVTKSRDLNPWFTQSQSLSQKSSKGQNKYNYQSDTSTQSKVSSTNIPVAPEMMIENSSGGQRVIIADSKSRILRQGDPTAFHTKIEHETPVEVNVNVDGQKLARKLVKLLTEEFKLGNWYYG